MDRGLQGRGPGSEECGNASDRRSTCLEHNKTLKKEPRKTLLGSVMERLQQEPWWVWTDRLKRNEA